MLYNVEVIFNDGTKITINNVDSVSFDSDERVWKQIAISELINFRAGIRDSDKVMFYLKEKDTNFSMISDWKNVRCVNFSKSL